MICREHKEGMVVTFIGCTREQINWGGNTDPSGILKEGEEYIVTKIDERTAHTKLTLKDIKGRFNSVCFR